MWRNKFLQQDPDKALEGTLKYPRAKQNYNTICVDIEEELAFAAVSLVRFQV